MNDEETDTLNWGRMSMDGWKGMYPGSREFYYCSEPCNGSLNPTLQITRDGSNMQNSSRVRIQRRTRRTYTTDRGWMRRQEEHYAWVKPAIVPPQTVKRNKRWVRPGLWVHRKPCLTNFTSSDSSDTFYTVNTSRQGWGYIINIILGEYFLYNNYT